MLLLSFAAAVGATLFVSELVLISNKKIVYTTFSAPTVIDWKKKNTPGAVQLGKKTLVVFFAKEHVIVGSTQAVTAPPPAGAVVLVSRQNWQAELQSAILKSVAVLDLFPVRTFGFASDSQTTDGKQPSYSEMLDVIALVNNINRRKSIDESAGAVPFLLDIKPGLLGVN
jgi:hypothetical protein